MITMLALAAATAAAPPSAPLPRMKAAVLQPGATCYAIVQVGTPVGATWQSIKPGRVGQVDIWDIVVHQRLPQAGFDMRDHFVVRRADLTPISLESRLGSDKTAKGWRRVTVRYSGDRITGSKEAAEGVTPIDVPLDHPVWDGNLWGLTFAALPLGDAKDFTVPVWQYDKGFGTFTVQVLDDGPADAWTLNAGDDPKRLARYVIGKSPRTERGYTVGPIGQQLGGDCTGLD